MPDLAILDDILPAERVPVRLTTLLTIVIAKELPEGHRFTPARQFILFCQLFFRKGLVRLDVLDGTDGQRLHVYAVQRVVAIDTGAVFITRLIVPETGTPSVSTAGLAFAVHLFFHRLLPPIRLHR
jgi:hypothetical protein